MKRRRGTGRLRDRKTINEDINPMDGLANLADVMLVFACGLMLSLITYWNVDVGGMVDVQQGQELTDVSGFDENSGEPLENADLQQYGTVYMDPDSGKLYMVTEEE